MTFPALAVKNRLHDLRVDQTFTCGDVGHDGHFLDFISCDAQGLSIPKLFEVTHEVLIGVNQLATHVCANRH